MRRLHPACRTAATAIVVAATACASNAYAPSHEAVPLGLDAAVPTPVDNVPTYAKVRVGERLFMDPLLSIDGSRRCASCHRPERAYSDSRRVSPGLPGQFTTRNAPALINRAWGRSQFRDGRASTLEAAVLQPVQNPSEMGVSLALLEQRLGADTVYVRLFADAFGTWGRAPTSDQAAAALAAYIRSIRSGDARVDRFAAGDTSALSVLERAGRDLFVGKAHCSECHRGPNFTDEGFHNTGITTRSGDPGRRAVTRDSRHQGEFRTPTLRDVALTAPYMHDGSVATLEDVVEFYDQGGLRNDNLDPLIRGLRLTESEKTALVAFLRALTGREMSRATAPPR
jgi:cytochrome c peroxidase